MSLIQKAFQAVKEGSFFSKVSAYLIASKRFYCLYNLCVPFIRVNENKIVCDNFVGSSYGDNPKYIAEEFLRQNKNADIVFLVERKKSSQYKFPSYVRTVPLYSVKHLYEMASAKFWVFNYRKAIHLHKKQNQFYIQTWHGSIGPKKCERAAENSLDKRYLWNAKKDSSQISLCISGSSHLSRIYKEEFWYNGEILECGSPRNDILFNAKNLDVIKEKLNAKGKKICLYAPTFRNNHSLQSYGLDYFSLKSTLEQKFCGNWIVFLRLHPNMADVDFGKLPDFIKNLSHYDDVQELLAVSDCLITDYSSIIYDFMLTRRPAFIFATDLKEYQKNERNLYFSLDSTPFTLAENNEELCESILNFNDEVYQTKINEFAKRMNVFDDGHASERVVQWMMKKLEEKS